ncbi:MAG: HAD family phosphatase [Candidatus Nomurabacteria bacterium]|jgi:HAD superfamily hydrolase (TIGR01490 family)|nr:HAD family phosphatase [Candidatus Nomurabacteria bacterium]
MSQKFAVFDVDGTLIRWQLYHAVVNRLARKGELGDSAYKKLKAARNRWKKREQVESFRDYEVELVHLWLDSMAQVSYTAYLEAVEETISEYVDQAYSYTRSLIKQLKADGYFLLTISASPEELVAKTAEHYGFDDYVAAQFERDGDKFTGQVVTPFYNKAERLQEMVKKHGLSWKESVAVGDTASDIQLLELVEKPIAFNPNGALAAKAIKRNWPVIVERKNVVYELKPGEWNIVS